MSEPTHDETSVVELPRLRIHHFFVLTTVFAVVMSVWLGTWNLFRSNQPSQAVPEITAEASLIVTVQSLPLSACAAVALLTFLLVATVSDLRQQRRLHWSHWLVLISTFVSTAVLAVYYHFVF